MRYIRDVVRNLTSATEESLFAMFKGFMDEGGISGQEVASVVAGFAGTGDECDSVADAWREIVKPIGEFHGREFFKRHADGSMAGKYKHLSVEQAESCALALVDLLAGTKLEPIGMVLDVRTYKTLSRDERRWMTSAVMYGKSWPMQGAPDEPWFAGFHYCITSANEYTPEGEQIYLTFDRQETYEGNAKKIYNELKQAGGKWGARLADTLLFSTRHEAILLQAADLLANALTKSVRDESDKKRKQNKVIVHALQKLAIDRDYIRVMDTPSIDAHLKKCPFRTTFWNGLTDPDVIEQAAGQGLNVLTIKADEGIYYTHHIRADRVRIIKELKPQPLPDARNLTGARDDSTK